MLYEAILEIYIDKKDPKKINKKKECLESLGEVYYYIGNYEKALEYFSEALKQGPNYWGYYHLFVVLYKRKKDGMAKSALDEACKFAENFIRKIPRNQKQQEHIENVREFYLPYMRRVKSRVDQEIKEQNRPRFFRNTTKSVKK